MTAIENHMNKTMIRRIQSVRRDYGDAFEKTIREDFEPFNIGENEIEFSEQPDYLNSK